MKLRSMPSKPSRSLATISGSPADGRRQAVEAALEVLGRLDDVAGEFLHRVLARLVHLAAARARTLAISASARIQRSLISASSASSAAMRAVAACISCFRREGCVLRQILRRRIGRGGVLILHGFLFDIRLRVPLAGSRIEMRFDGHGPYRMIGGHQLGNGARKNNRFRVDSTINRSSGPSSRHFGASYTTLAAKDSSALH